MRFTPANRAALVAFLVAGATLFVQILLHRLVSAKLLNNLAFLTISVTMLGFALSGVVLARWLPRFLAALDDTVNACGALFVIGSVGVAAAFARIDVTPQTLQLSETAVAAWMPLSLLLTLPFAFSGLALGTLLSAPELPSRRIYFFDMIGSAAGAFAVIPSITWLGVEPSLLLACAALLAGVQVLAPPRRVGSRLLAGAAFVVLGVAAIESATLFRIRYPAGSILADIEAAGPPARIERVVWDPLARIELSRFVPPLAEMTLLPSLVGRNPALHARFTHLFTQNNFAFTYALDYDGSRASLDGIEETLYAAAYQAGAAPRPRVIVIGVGGGFDVLTAIRFDASDITGVEVNAATVRILTRLERERFRNWVEDPRLRLAQAEGRHYLSTTDRRFDVIQMSGIDSYAGTAAAAHVFSESYLYTEEAFDLYLSRLGPAGILNMMRTEYVPPREMLRAVTTAVAALRRAGARRPSDHIVTLTQYDGIFTALLVKKTPFGDDELRRLEAWAGRSGSFAVSAAPGSNGRRANHYQRFLDLDDPRLERVFIASAPFDIAPVGDDRPFFFKHSFWWHLFSKDPAIPRPVMESSVVMLVAVLGVAAGFCIYLPLRQFAAAGRRVPAAWRYGVFFAGTGVGYLAIEIALLQKFGLFLGHPNYALSVVLAALLFSTGVGSLGSGTILGRLGRLRYMSYLVAGVVLLEQLAVLPHLGDLVGLPSWLKVVVVVGLVAPIGVGLGTFFPTGLSRLKLVHPEFVPWAWGINGIFSVLAPVLSVALAITWGTNALLLAALPVYLLAGFAFPEPATD